VPAHRGRLGEFRHRDAACGYAGEVEAVQSPSITAKKLTVERGKAVLLRRPGGSFDTNYIGY
jgi:hypothetical protein